MVILNEMRRPIQCQWDHSNCEAVAKFHLSKKNCRHPETLPRRTATGWGTGLFLCREHLNLHRSQTGWQPSGVRFDASELSDFDDQLNSIRAGDPPRALASLEDQGIRFHGYGIASLRQSWDRHRGLFGHRAGRLVVAFSQQDLQVSQIDELAFLIGQVFQVFVADKELIHKLLATQGDSPGIQSILAE